MSRGPGQIEHRIIELLAKTKDGALTVGDLCAHAFQLPRAAIPSRSQRLSATRAAHNIIKRLAEARDGRRVALDRVIAEARAKLGRRPTGRDDVYFIAAGGMDVRAVDEQFAVAMGTCPGWPHYTAAWKVLRRECDRLGKAANTGWRSTEMPDHRIRFHPADWPQRVWAVAITPAGVIWADAEIVRITETQVMVRYGGAVARLDRRKLGRSWTIYRNVYFTSSRTGYAARTFDDMWQQHYGWHPGGSVPPIMQMPLADAIALLGVPINFTCDDIILAFRREAKKAHPDAGGTAEQFRKLVEARDRLLASLGTAEPAPEMPAYAPTGARLRYRTYRPGASRRGIGHARSLPGG